MGLARMYAPVLIFSRGYSLQVLRIHTAAVGAVISTLTTRVGSVAEMVALQPLRDRPNNPFVHHAMHWVDFSLDRDLAVALPVAVSRPKPAVRRQEGIVAQAVSQ